MTNSGTNAIIVVLITAPSVDVAQQIAATLVEERLAACCTILPAVRSVYRWEGRVEDAEEVLVLVKTAQEFFPQLQQRVLELHPYQLPEVIAVPVVAGLAGYVDWVLDSVRR
ncbi:MAG: divalent-cation tolerance protein CutA [Chlorobi bacterium]|nr:MAG: Divalent-cation tolerance protein CutA [Chlorobi bacterium OLB7]MBK8912262.1 divalent-cation tolerance protein CutA [Chlorobiota bacterium]MBX7215978.1 divalent-cation tolerance protein CutA [Candidatus Kapabacteria bacterium]